ncbi:RNA-directed DNA polymerase, eukaryota, reverse transcriptase zinc-binding domain protein [Tanacetum coccineum]
MIGSCTRYGGFKATTREDVEVGEDQSNQRNGSVRESGKGIWSIHGEEEDSEAMKSHSKKKSKEDVTESVGSGHFKKSENPCSGGSILLLMDELVKVGQTMGYNMEGLTQKAKKDWVKELCVSNKVNFLSLQETKIETIQLFDIKRCWGNFAFNYVHSASVGNSGGILCVWDSNSFKKLSATVSDYFVIIRGEVIIMGDFNEVRNKNERFGSVFNVQGANAFNLFISSAGLEEVPLGVDGFEKLVEESWTEAPVDGSNAILNLMKKLKYLKKKIRVWNNDMRKRSKNSKLTFLAELSESDMVIDKG